MLAGSRKEPCWNCLEDASVCLTVRESIAEQKVWGKTDYDCLASPQSSRFYGEGYLMDACMPLCLSKGGYYRRGQVYQEWDRQAGR